MTLVFSKSSSLRLFFLDQGQTRFLPLNNAAFNFQHVSEAFFPQDGRSFSRTRSGAAVDQISRYFGQAFSFVRKIRRVEIEEYGAGDMPGLEGHLRAIGSAHL